MPRGSLALRSTQNWRLMANEQKVSDRIPLIRIRDGNTLISKSGDALRVFRLRGIASETMAPQSVEAVRDTLASLYRQHGDARTAFYVHTIRTRLREKDLPKRKQAAGFAGYVDTLRRAELATSALYRIEHYLTVVRRPLIKTPQWFAARREAASHPDDRMQARTESFRALDEIGLAVQTLLGRLAPEPLTTQSGDGNALTGFLSTLVNGAPIPMQQASTGLDVLLPTHRPIFRGETIELRGPAPDDTRYAAMMALKAYGDATWPGALNAMLAAPCEFIMTQSFIPRELSDTLSRMKWTRRKMEVAEDEAHSLAEDLDSAMDDVAAGREVFGDHHLSIAVLADSDAELASATSDMAATLTAANLRPVREDIALEALWWAQIPGNMAYRVRTALISGRNFADLAPFHTHASGNNTNLTWDVPIALLETDSGTPFWFNFHARGQNANGNTLVFGPSGAGKTALISVLVTSAMTLPRSPRIFYFDKDRGAEATIRALGGRYACLRPDDGTGFNPFAEATDKRGQSEHRRVMERLRLESELASIERTETRKLEEQLSAVEHTRRMELAALEKSHTDATDRAKFERDRELLQLEAQLRANEISVERAAAERERIAAEHKIEEERARAKAEADMAAAKAAALKFEEEERARRESGGIVIDDTGAASGVGIQTASLGGSVFGSGGDASRLLLEGTLISGILETAIQSDLPGSIRAIVSDDVWSADASQIVLPKGSRLIGRYESGLSQGQSRVLIAWTRAVTPDHRSIKLDASGVDGLGRSGLSGDVDQHFGTKFEAAFMISVVSAIGSLGANAALPRAEFREALNAGSETVTETANDALGEYLSIPPTIHVDQGTPINVFVSQDFLL